MLIQKVRCWPHKERHTWNSLRAAVPVNKFVQLEIEGQRQEEQEHEDPSLRECLSAKVQHAYVGLKAAPDQLSLVRWVQNECREAMTVVE